MPTSATTLLSRLYARPTLLAAVNEQAGSPLSAEQLALVERRSGAWTVADVPLLDELEELLGPLPASSSPSASVNDDVARAQEAIDAQGLGGGIVTAAMLAAATSDRNEWAPLAERATTDRAWTYGHVVVDEAQDLSPMA